MELHTSFNTLDYIVLAIILLSGLLAVFSGFVREVLSLVNWTASAYIGVHYYRFAVPYVKKYISNPTTMVDLSIFAVFCVSFIILALVFNLFTRLVIRGATLTSIDRSLGFAFGLVRGVFLVCLLYLVVTLVLWPDIDKQPDSNAQVVVEADHSDHKDDLKKDDSKRHISFAAPHWLTEAKTRPMLARGASLLQEFVPRDALEKTTKEYLNKKDAYEKKVSDDVMGIDVNATKNSGKEP